MASLSHSLSPLSMSPLYYCTLMPGRSLTLIGIPPSDAHPRRLVASREVASRAQGDMPSIHRIIHLREQLAKGLAFLPALPPPSKPRLRVPELENVRQHRVFLLSMTFCPVSNFSLSCSPPFASSDFPGLRRGQARMPVPFWPVSSRTPERPVCRESS